VNLVCAKFGFVSWRFRLVLDDFLVTLFPLFACSYLLVSVRVLDSRGRAAGAVPAKARDSATNADLQASCVLITAALVFGPGLARFLSVPSLLQLVRIVVRSSRLVQFPSRSLCG